MKKTLTAIALALLTIGLPALSSAKDTGKKAKPALDASEREQLNLMRASIRIDKRNFIKDAMELDKEEATKFWSIYHQYEAELMKLNDDRQDVIEDYAKNYADITEAKADDSHQYGHSTEHYPEYHGQYQAEYEPEHCEELPS